VLFTGAVLAAESEKLNDQKPSPITTEQEKIKHLPTSKTESSGKDEARSDDHEVGHNEKQSENDKSHRDSHKGHRNSHGKKYKHKGHQASGMKKGNNNRNLKGYNQSHQQNQQKIGPKKGHHGQKVKQYDNRDGQQNKGKKAFRRIHRIETHEMYFDDVDDHDNDGNHGFNQGEKPGTYSYHDLGYRGLQDRYRLANQDRYSHHGLVDGEDHLGNDGYNDRWIHLWP